MKLALIRLFTLAAAGSLFFIIFLSFRSPEKNNSEEGQTASVSKIFPQAPTADRILLQGPGGGVWVNNFYKFAKAAIPGSNSVLITSVPDYDIIYYREDSSFELALGFSASPAERSAAENSIFNILGAGKQELCKLKMSVSSINMSGDKEYSPLSFCRSVFLAQ